MEGKTLSFHSRSLQIFPFIRTLLSSHPPFNSFPNSSMMDVIRYSVPLFNTIVPHRAMVALALVPDPEIPLPN